MNPLATEGQVRFEIFWPGMILAQYQFVPLDRCDGLSGAGTSLYILTSNSSVSLSPGVAGAEDLWFCSTHFHLVVH